MKITIYIRPTGKLAAVDDNGRRLYQNTDGTTEKDVTDLLAHFINGYAVKGTPHLVKQAEGKCFEYPSYLWTYELKEEE